MMFLMFLLPFQGTMGFETRGSITSPGYPAQYPDNSNSTWTINAPHNASVVLIEIHDQDIEETPGFECTDFLEIKELSETASFVLFKQCGRGTLSKIHANSNKIKVSFISDESKTGKGFNLTWSVLEYKQVPPTLKSTTVAFTNIGKFSSKDHGDGSTHKVLHRSTTARFPPHTTMGLVTTFPTLSLINESQQHPTSSGQSHGVVTKLIHMYTLSKKSSVRTDLNTLHKTSPTILQISTTTRQKTETIQRTPSTGIANDRVETRENESKMSILLFGRTTDSPINQPVSPFYSPGIVPSTIPRSKVINKEHSSTYYEVPSSETLDLVSTAHGRDLPSTKSNVDVVDSSMSTENKYIPDSSSTERMPLKSTLPVLKLDPITTDTLHGLSLTLLCIIGVLILLVCSLIVLAVVQKMKIKSLQRSSDARKRDRYNPIAEMVDWKSENHQYLDLKQCDITTDKTKNLPNDYMYSFIEACNKDAKQLNVIQLQAEANRSSFSPEDLTELHEKADYVEILPDRVSYCKDTTTFKGNPSDSCYSQIVKKRDDKIVNTETESKRMSLKQGSSGASIDSNALSENDDEYSGLSRSISSETDNVSVSKCEIIMVGKFDNDVYEDLPI